MKIEDCAGSEKLARRRRKLYAAGAKRGLDPKKGGIAPFCPPGDLAIRYKKGHSSGGLYYLGNIASGLDILAAGKGGKVSAFIISAKLRFAFPKDKNI